MNKKNYNSLDLWKFIMAFAVVAIHTRPLEYVQNDSIVNIYTIFVTMAVPCFFLASGYLMAAKMNWDYEENDFERIRNQIRRISKMYLIWTAIYFPLAIYHFISTKTPPVEAILIYVAKFFFVGEQYNSWPLWFLLSAIYSLIVISLFMKKCKKPEYLIILTVIGTVIYLSVTSFACYEGVYSPDIEALRSLVKWTIGTARLFMGLIYIPLGMLLSEKKIDTRINWAMLVASAVANFFISNEWFSGLLTIIASVALFGLIEATCLKDKAIYARLRAHSTVIYLIHMYIWSIYYKIVYGEKTYGFDGFIVTSLVSLLLAILYYYGRKKIKQQS